MPAWGSREWRRSRAGLPAAHQAFFTVDALRRIAETTLTDLTAFERAGAPLHEVARDSG